MQNILVTGGLGFIGSNLIELLLLKKYKVLNLDKVSYSSNFYNTKEFVKNVGTLPERREVQKQHQIEKVGESLRSMMPWIKKIVDKSKN